MNNSQSDQTAEILVGIEIAQAVLNNTKSYLFPSVEYEYYASTATCKYEQLPKHSWRQMIETFKCSYECEQPRFEADKVDEDEGLSFVVTSVFVLGTVLSVTNCMVYKLYN